MTDWSYLPVKKYNDRSDETLYPRSWKEALRLMLGALDSRGQFGLFPDQMTWFPDFDPLDLATAMDAEAGYDPDENMIVIERRPK